MALLSLSDRLRYEREEIVCHTPSAQERCRARALLGLADGSGVEEVAERLHSSRQTLSNWVGRSRERDDLGVRARLLDAPRPGRPPSAGGLIDRLIVCVIDGDPRVLGYHSTVGTAPLLCRSSWDYHEIEVSERTVGRAIDRLRIRWKRPRHELARRPATWRQSKGGSRPAWTARSGRPC